jgi:hypothetical protein
VYSPAYGNVNCRANVPSFCIAGCSWRNHDRSLDTISKCSGFSWTVSNLVIFKPVGFLTLKVSDATLPAEIPPPQVPLTSRTATEYRSLVCCLRFILQTGQVPGLS